MKSLFLLVATFLIMSSFSQERYFNTIYINQVVDTMPKYPGGEIELYRFIEENFYRSYAVRCRGINTVVVSFIVDSLGKISDVYFPVSPSATVETKMLQIVNKLPDWTPGYYAGQPCAVRIYIPVKYVCEGHTITIVNSGTEMTVGYSEKANWLKAILITICVGGMFFFLGRGIWF